MSDVIEIARYSGACALCRAPIEPGSQYRRRGHNHCEHIACPPTAGAPSPSRDVRIEDGRRLYVGAELVVERPMTRRQAGDEISREAIAELRAGRATDFRVALYTALRRDPARALTYHTGG
jgi:hypothetical protein